MCLSITYNKIPPSPKKNNNNHVASCLKQRESVPQILRLSSGPSNLLLILPAVKSECDMFSKRKDDLLGMESYSSYCPWCSRMTWFIVTTPRCPRNDTLQKLGILTAKGFVDAVRKKEIIVITVLRKKTDCLISGTESPHPPLRAHSLIWPNPMTWIKEWSQLSFQGPLPTHSLSATSCFNSNDLNLLPPSIKCAVCQIACAPENRGRQSHRCLGDHHFSDS